MRRCALGAINIRRDTIKPESMMVKWTIQTYTKTKLSFQTLTVTDFEPDYLWLAKPENSTTLVDICIIRTTRNTPCGLSCAPPSLVFVRNCGYVANSASETHVWLGSTRTTRIKLNNSYSPHRRGLQATSWARPTQHDDLVNALPEQHIERLHSRERRLFIWQPTRCYSSDLASHPRLGETAQGNGGDTCCPSWTVGRKISKQIQARQLRPHTQRQPTYKLLE